MKKSSGGKKAGGGKPSFPFKSGSGGKGGMKGGGKGKSPRC